jgi:hypothetical protein
MSTMSKRVLAAFLWLVAGWYIGSSVALVFGLPELLGPILGIAAAGFFGGDPFGMIWRQTADPSMVTAVDLEDLPDDLAHAA